MNKYKNKRILIIGLGKTGYSCLKFFKLKKSIIYIIDEKKKNLNNINIPKENIFLGCLKISWVLKSDLIIISPGINYNKPEIKMASFYNIDIVNDIEIFYREVKNKNIIAITGSNGKSTISTLVYKIIKKSNIKVSIGGNIGIPVLNLLKKKSEIYILELSSFQIEILNKFRSNISIISNITRNHLDKHKNFYNYKKCKLKLFKKSSICIYNKNDINTLYKKNNLKKKYITFGLLSGDYKLIYENNNIFLSKKNKKFINSNLLKVSGNHFYLNFLASLAITDLIKKVSNKSQINIIKNFKGLKNRFKIVKKKNKITWINDSKSTNPYSTIVAINSIKKYNYIHLLIGGYSKFNNFNLLSNFIKYKKIIIYFFGLDGKNISYIFYNLFIYKKDIKDLLFIIKNNCKKNDVVLFSPSCSSLDKFSSFEERGKYFEKKIKNFY